MTDIMPWTRFRRHAVIGVILLLMLAHALPFAWATVTLDTARDLAAAYRISQGELLLRGPVLNGLFHLGPIWFYLLAPVLALTKSQALTLLWVGVLAATKIPLAYALGKSLRDAELGLCMAALIALPGWSSMGSVFPTHTVLVESTVLLQLCLMHRLVRGASHWHWALLGLASGLALHAHPSAAFVLMLVPWVLWNRRKSIRWKAFAAIFVGALLFLLLLLPMLIAEHREAWPALAPTTAFAEDSAHRFSASETLRILQGALIEGPRVALALTGSTAIVDVLLVLTAALAVFGLLGNLRDAARPQRMSTLIALMLLPLLALMLSGVRDYTPFYMALLLLPIGWAAVAMGLRHLPKVHAWIVLAVVLAIAGNAILVASAESGHAHINVARLSNVRNAVPKPVDAALLPAWQLDELSRALCETEREVVLHGYLALLYDASLALGPELRCGKRNAAALAGKGGTSSAHWLGLPPALAREFGLQTGRSWNDTPKIGVQALSPATALPPADRLHYPHHIASGAAATPHRWNVQGDGHRTILITTDLLYPYRVNRVEAVLANGIDARKVAEMNVTQVWVCDHCDGGLIDWEVRALSNDPDVLDIVAIAPPAHEANAGD